MSTIFRSKISPLVCVCVFIWLGKCRLGILKILHVNAQTPFVYNTILLAIVSATLLFQGQMQPWGEKSAWSWLDRERCRGSCSLIFGPCSSQETPFSVYSCFNKALNSFSPTITAHWAESSQSSPLFIMAAVCGTPPGHSWCSSGRLRRIFDATLTSRARTTKGRGMQSVKQEITDF